MFPSLSEWSAAYLRNLKQRAQASRHTLSNYEIDLRHWIKFLSQTKTASVELLGDSELLTQYVALLEGQYEPATVVRRFTTVKRFLRYLQEKRLLTKNRSRLVRLPKASPKIPQVLSIAKLDEFINDCPTRTLREKRLRAIIELIYSTGIRVSELVALKVIDLDLRQNVIRNIGKTSRIVPLNHHSHRAIQEYLDSLPPSYRKQTWVFLNAEGEKLSVRTVQRDLKHLALSLGKDGEHLTPHSLRHCCAQHMYSQGATLKDIQLLLGHESLLTTQKYSQPNFDRVQNAYRRAKGEVL